MSNQSPSYDIARQVIEAALLGKLQLNKPVYDIILRVRTMSDAWAFVRQAIKEYRVQGAWNSWTKHEYPSSIPALQTPHRRSQPFHDYYDQ